MTIQRRDVVFLFWLLMVPSGITLADRRPNILLIMVDDLGFADFGCYGSEIQTPNIDALAEGGLRLSQFYNTGKCATSRVSLLSGLYPDQCGAGFRRGTTIPEVLSEAGYFTSMTGKWHLSQQPTDFGFMRYWGHLSGATDFFIGDETFRLNGQNWDDFGEDFYTTDANVDYSIEFIDASVDRAKPFFHYKQTQHEGGIASPLIVHYPNHIQNAGRWEHQRGHLVDIMATCLDVGGASYPSSDAIQRQAFPRIWIISRCLKTG